MAQIELKGKTPLTSLEKSDRIMIIDENDTVVEVTTLQTLLNFLDSCGVVLDAELTTALLTKADVNHTHTIAQVDGLQTRIDTFQDFLDNSGIVGETIFIGGQSIVVNQGGTGGGGTVNANDPRLPDNVGVGNYLRISATDGTLEQVTIDQLKVDLSIENVDNTSDLNKPVSTLTQVQIDRLDERIDDLDFNGATDLTAVSDADSVLITSSTGTNATINQASTTSAGVMSNVDKAHLDSTEFGADVTDTENVREALGISAAGSTTNVLSQIGVFVPQLGGGTINIEGDNLNVQLTDTPQLVPPLAIAILNNETAYLNTSDAAVSVSLDSVFPDTVWLDVAGGGGGGAVLLTTNLQIIPSGGIAVVDENNQYYNTSSGSIMANSTTDFTASPWVKVGKQQGANWAAEEGEAGYIAFKPNITSGNKYTQGIFLTGVHTNTVTDIQTEVYKVDVLEEWALETSSESFEYSLDLDVNSEYLQGNSTITGHLVGPATYTDLLNDIGTKAEALVGIEWDGTIEDTTDGTFTSDFTTVFGAVSSGSNFKNPFDNPTGIVFGWYKADTPSPYGGTGVAYPYTSPDDDDDIEWFSTARSSAFSSAMGFGDGLLFEHWNPTAGQEIIITTETGASGRFSLSPTEIIDGFSLTHLETINGSLLNVDGVFQDNVTITVLNAVESKRITLEYQTQDNIEQAFEVLNSDVEDDYDRYNLSSLHGDEGSDQTIITLIDHTGNEVFSYGSHSDGTNNSAEVAAEITSIINDNIENPNWTAIRNDLHISLETDYITEDASAGWSITIDNQGGDGNIIVETEDVESEARTIIENVLLRNGVYFDLPDANPGIDAQAWNNNDALNISSGFVGGLNLISISNLNFTHDGQTATVTVLGEVGTNFNLQVVNTNPLGWLTAGALGATSGTIPAEGSFVTLLSIPAGDPQTTFSRTAAIQAVNSDTTLNTVTTGLFTQSHDHTVSSGNLTASTDAVIVGANATFSAEITSGDPDFTIELYDSDPTTGSPTALQTGTLTALGTHTFTAIDTSSFANGDHTYWIRISDSDGDLVIEMETITILAGAAGFYDFQPEYGLALGNIQMSMLSEESATFRITDASSTKDVALAQISEEYWLFGGGNAAISAAGNVFVQNISESPAVTIAEWTFNGNIASPTDQEVEDNLIIAPPALSFGLWGSRTNAGSSLGLNYTLSYSINGGVVQTATTQGGNGFAEFSGLPFTSGQEVTMQVTNTEYNISSPQVTHTIL